MHSLETIVRLNKEAVQREQDAEYQKVLAELKNLKRKSIFTFDVKK